MVESYCYTQLRPPLHYSSHRQAASARNFSQLVPPASVEVEKNELRKSQTREKGTIELISLDSECRHQCRSSIIPNIPAPLARLPIGTTPIQGPRISDFLGPSLVSGSGVDDHLI